MAGYDSERDLRFCVPGTGITVLSVVYRHGEYDPLVNVTLRMDVNGALRKVSSRLNLELGVFLDPVPGDDQATLVLTDHASEVAAYLQPVLYG